MAGMHQGGRLRQKRERAIRILFFCIALASITTLALIVVFLFMEGLPIFAKVSVHDFIFGTYWYPTDEPPDFGIFPLIMASLAVTATASLIAIPLGVLTALYLAEVASARVREWVKPIVELLAALPSVVIGFFGMVIVAPFLQEILDIPTGLNLFNASLMLAFMSIPTICSISEDAIFSVPTELKEASLGLGATKWQTVYRVVLPAALPGILTGAILGISRAAGETAPIMFTAAVFFTPSLPKSIFDEIMALPYHVYVLATAGTEIEKTRHLQYGTALVLIALVLGLNLLAILYRARLRRKR